jgi:mRNA-degrading endonuclease RelE of RelBE toxin-antitoxin system
MLNIYFKPTFVKKFKKLDQSLQTEVLKKIELFKDRKNHKSLEVHKLKKELVGSFAFSINYKDRIIFDWLSSDEVVLLSAGDHSIYKK